MSIPQHLRLLTIALLLAPAAIAAPPLRVSAQLPARIDDGTPLVAAVTLTNVSGQPLTIYTPDATTVRFTVEQKVDFGTGKWVQHLISDSLIAAHPLVTLAPTQTVSAQVPVLSAYPLGVAPGEYSVRAVYQMLPDMKGMQWYGTAESAPAALTIAAPQTPAYEAFLRAWRAAAAHDPATASLALDFARLHPDHPYAAPLLVSVLSYADAAKAQQIAAFISSTYPRSAYATQAATIASSVQQRDGDRAAYEQYTAAMKAYGAAHPAIREAAGHMLGTIGDARGFDRAEAFIRQYPDSPYAAEALWLMINAVDSGVLPGGKTPAEREHVLAGLYRRLLDHPENYWARRAMRNPAVAAMLKGTRE